MTTVSQFTIRFRVNYFLTIWVCGKDEQEKSNVFKLLQLFVGVNLMANFATEVFRHYDKGSYSILPVLGIHR